MWQQTRKYISISLLILVCIGLFPRTYAIAPVQKVARVSVLQYVISIPDGSSVEGRFVAGNLLELAELQRNIDQLSLDQILLLAQQLDQRDPIELQRKVYLGNLLEHCLVRLAQADYEPAFDLLSNHTNFVWLSKPGDHAGEIPGYGLIDMPRPIWESLVHASSRILPKLFYRLETTTNSSEALSLMLLINTISRTNGLPENDRAIRILDDRFPD